jgi:uroporphyrinogen decarboxylase
MQAALSGQSVDRPPVCFWHHFSPNGSAGNMAKCTVDFFAREFDLDIAKVMLDIPYPVPRKSIDSSSAWRLIQDWGGTENAFTSSYVSAVRQVRSILGPAYPLLLTVYSPTTWALLFGDERSRLLRDLEKSPGVIHAALGNIALNLRRLVAACIEAGADGIFYSSHGCDSEIPQPIYNEIGRPYDLMVLQGAQIGWFNLMHVHSDDSLLRVEDVLDYPVCGFSWADIKSGRSISSVRAITGKCLMGGWDRTSPRLTDEKADFESLVSASVEDARSAVAQAGGRGIILAPGCSIPSNSTQLALKAYRAAVDRL